MKGTAQKRLVLIIEDEDDLAELLRYNLEREGYSCQRAADGAAALKAVEKSLPDLILLDRMLPQLSGDKVVAALKQEQRTASVPVIMLTAKAEESDELVGFALGADDYVSKPFSMKKLLARIAAVLRRTESADKPSPRLNIGPFLLDQGRHLLTVDGGPVGLTATEFRLLGALMSADGRVLSRADLIDAGMGFDIAVTERTIDVHITSIRKKVAAARPEVEASQWIQTVRGIGYTFRPPQ